MNDRSLHTYLLKINEVQGWCNPKIFSGIESFSRLQLENSVNGGVCEIGVHHGKFFLGLHNISNGEFSLAIDIFGNQELNVDGSGSGVLELFLKNVEKHACRPDKVHHYINDSLSISHEDVARIIREFQTFRLFSIDGGHTAEHTINDFRLAEQLVSNGGIVFVDDYHNPHWPGVQEGVAYLYINSRPKLVPFMYCCGKLFLTTLGFHRRYFDFAKSNAYGFFPGADFKHVQIFGHDVMASMV